MAGMVATRQAIDGDAGRSGANPDQMRESSARLIEAALGERVGRELSAIATQHRIAVDELTRHQRDLLDRILDEVKDTVQWLDQRESDLDKRVQRAVLWVVESEIRPQIQEILGGQDRMLTELENLRTARSGRPAISGLLWAGGLVVAFVLGALLGSQISAITEIVRSLLP